MTTSTARTGDRLRVAFTGAAVAWTCLIAAAPFLATRAHASTLGAAVVLAVYGIGSIVCHQLPDRSFHLLSAQLPVCARCTGIYFGAAAAAVLLPPVASVRAAGRRARIGLAAAAMPTAATLLYEWTTGVTPANAIRFAAGLPLGAAAAWLVVAASRNQVN